MLIRVDSASVRVEEPDNLRRLHVITSLDTATADRVLRESGLGSVLSAGRVALDVNALHNHARHSRKAPSHIDGWDERWAAMLAYAAGHGWMSAEGRNLIAHIETS